MPRDARTTPRWLQLPALVSLVLLAAYLLTAFRYAKNDDEPTFFREHPYVLWLGTWHMFTSLDPGHSMLVAEARYPGDDTWQDFDLTELFPYKWESGYRFSRSSFRKSGSRMRTLAQAACHRAERRPERLRFKEVRWNKTLGSKEQPFKRKREKDLMEWDCDKSYRLPKGRVL